MKTSILMQNKTEIDLPEFFIADGDYCMQHKNMLLRITIGEYFFSVGLFFPQATYYSIKAVSKEEFFEVYNKYVKGLTDLSFNNLIKE